MAAEDDFRWNEFELPFSLLIFEVEAWFQFNFCWQRLRRGLYCVDKSVYSLSTTYVQSNFEKKRVVQ